MGDVILLGAAVRLALDAGRRGRTFCLIASSIALLLVTDFIYGVLTLPASSTTSSGSTAGWIGSYVLWGAAGLHPSMASLAEPTPPRETVLLTPFRLVLLTLASLIAPAIVTLDDIARATSTLPRASAPRSRSSRS